VEQAGNTKEAQKKRLSDEVQMHPGDQDACGVGHLRALGECKIKAKALCAKKREPLCALNFS